MDCAGAQPQTTRYPNLGTVGTALGGANVHVEEDGGGTSGRAGAALLHANNINIVLMEQVCRISAFFLGAVLCGLVVPAAGPPPHRLSYNTTEEPTKASENEAPLVCTELERCSVKEKKSWRNQEAQFTS